VDVVYYIDNPAADYELVVQAIEEDLHVPGGTIRAFGLRRTGPYGRNIDRHSRGSTRESKDGLSCYLVERLHESRIDPLQDLRVSATYSWPHGNIGVEVGSGIIVELVLRANILLGIDALDLISTP
jgi:hypothetical protein